MASGMGVVRRLAWFLGMSLLGAGVSFAQPTYTEVTPPGTGVTASTDDGNVPANTVDNNVATRWSAQNDGQWIRYDLGSPVVVAYLKIASYSGNTRRARFDIQVSNDGAAWNTVWVGQSSGTTTAQETYEIADVEARYVRLLGHGNSANAWNSFIEVDLFASSGGPEPPTPSPTPTATPVPTATPTPTAPPTPRPSPTAIPPGGPYSEHVHLADDGRLQYFPYPNGDRIPDFSYAGYMGGGVSLPNVPVVKTIGPVAGDDGASIQAAIDEVSALAPDAQGFRGAVLLTAGSYDVASGVTIRTSGVVLRGEGDGPAGTVIRAVGTARRTVITVSGVGNRTEVAGTKQAIADPYVPVGVHSFYVVDGSGFHPGDDIVVVRTPNQEWIDLVGTDQCGVVGTAFDTSDVDNSTCLSESFWKPSDRIMKYERKVVAVVGNEITVDAPMVEAIQSEWGGGYVAKYTFPGRIQQCGVESLRSESDFASDTDENHATRMIAFGNVENAWVRDSTSVYFEQGTFLGGGGAKYVTVQDSQSLDHKSVITGGRRYPFSLDDSSFVLVMRCYAKTGRHDYVTGSNTPGPNVFLNSVGDQSYSELGPHHRWATGSLFDRIVHKSYNGSQIMGTYNRGNSGSGHGWSGAYQLFWNCIGDTHKVASPPAARNWSIGCQVKKTQGDGEFEAVGLPVKPGSLYLQQLKDRLGATALVRIGFSDVLAPPTPTPAPTASPTPSPTPTPTGLIFEAETLPFTTSGPGNTSGADPLASAGIWMSCSAKVVGDWVEYTLPSIPRGTYDFKFKYKTNPARAIHNVALDGVVIGGTIDQYKTGAGTFPEVTMGTVRFDTAGPHVVRLTAVGKRTESTAYTVSSDRFVFVADTTRPVITPPDDITAEATGPDGAAVTFTATATDNKDGAVGVTSMPASGSTFALGLSTVALTAQDFAGNVASASFAIEVVDTTPPALDVPDDVTVEATGPDGAVVSFAAHAHDLVSGDVAVQYDLPPGMTFPLGLGVVTATATDGSDNTSRAIFTVSVVDTTPPTLTLPGPLVVEATGPEGAVVTYAASAQDLVSGALPVTLSVPSEATFALGTTTVEASATDAAGNTRTGSFTVTVVDTTAPALTLPAPLVLEATGPAGAAATYSASALDAVSGSVAVTLTPASGSTFALGTATVEASATDAAGNVGTGQFTVTVVDTTGPVLTLPAPIVAEATGSAGAVVTFGATAADLAAGSLPVSLTPASGSTFPLGTTTVHAVATDPSGNHTTGTFTVTVRDGTKPVFVSLTASPNVLWPPDHKMVPVKITASVSDAVTGTPAVRIVDVSSNEPVDGVCDGHTSPDWKVTGALTLQVRAERSSHGSGRIYTITVEATDAAGNATRSTVTVSVPRKKPRGNDHGGHGHDRDDDDDDDDHDRHNDHDRNHGRGGRH